MSLRNKIARSLYRLALRMAGNRSPERRFAGDAEPYYDSDWGIPRHENFETYVAAYTSNPWVNGAIKARADATAMAPLKFYRSRQVFNAATGVYDTAKEEVPTRKGSIPAMFQKPNSYMTSHDLWEWVTAFLLLDGNAYIYIDRKTKELWPLIPSRVRIKPHRTKYIAKYIYTVNGKKTYIDPRDIFHFKRFNPLNSYYGMGDIEALYFDLNLDSKTKKYLMKFFDRGARLSGVVELDEDLTTDELNRLEFQFNSEHGGVDRMHKIAFLPEKAKWVRNGQTNQELGIGDLSLLSRDSVMAIFRTPPAILGRWEQARFSNAREQIRLFFEGVQLSFWLKLASAINLHPDMMEAGLTAAFDVLQVAQLREGDNEKAERGRLLIQSGQWTINEVRKDLWNKSPVDGGDEIIIPKTGRNEDAGNNDPKHDDKKEKSKDPAKDQKKDPAEDLVDQTEEEMQDLDGEVPMIRASMERLELQEVA